MGQGVQAAQCSRPGSACAWQEVGSRGSRLERGDLQSRPHGAEQGCASCRVHGRPLLQVVFMVTGTWERWGTINFGCMCQRCMPSKLLHPS